MSNFKQEDGPDGYLQTNVFLLQSDSLQVAGKTHPSNILTELPMRRVHIFMFDLSQSIAQIGGFWAATTATMYVFTFSLLTYLFWNDLAW